VFACFDFVAERNYLSGFCICSVQEVADWQLTFILVDLLRRINCHLRCVHCPACFLPFDVLVGVFYIYKYYLKHSYISNRHKHLNISCISIHMIFLNIKLII